ncbi:MAG: DNA translocase FtsK [Thermodesulfovibrionales bacterium]
MAKNIARIREEIVGIVSVLGGIYTGLSFGSYSKWDNAFFTYSADPVGNYGGIVGAYLSDLAISVIGYAALFIPAFLIIYGGRRILGREKHRIYLVGFGVLLPATSLMLGLLSASFTLPGEIGPGGLFGGQIAGFLMKYLSTPGAYILVLSALLSAVILLTPFSFSTLAAGWPWKNVSPPAAPAKPARSLIEDEIFVRPPKVEEPVSDEPPAPPKPRPTPAEPRRPKPQPAVVTKDGYRLPPIELLAEYDAAAGVSEQEKRDNIAILIKTLADFGVKGEITQAKSGPVITMYEFEATQAIKISKVESLSGELALPIKGVSSQNLRITPIPGENRIGIEVPNRQRQIVSFRDIIGSDSFQKGSSRLALALGKDIYGEPVVADLTKMPHLLVAGTTGAGKSVSINTMVMSMLYKSSPREVKMLMIDPKLLELSMYEDIPHLLAPVITSPKQASEALRKMVFEMERRYRVLAEKGARNIESYNKAAGQDDQMPYIVVVIDELADLMFASSREIEDSIARLAQMARAAGIHLIIATQRPSVDVITGVIKANFPARISFQVLSKIDSRTILDSQGAEALLGKGDMLMLMPGSRLTRVHGALVTEDEIKAATEHVKAQAQPDFTLFQEIPAEAPPEEGEDDERDEMYDRAVEFAESVNEVSISSIQRRFKIGYNRAARIMEIMEKDGHVGPSKGAGKPREFRRFGFRGE